MNGLDPEAKLRYVPARIGEHPIKRIEELLPWNVAENWPPRYDKLTSRLNPTEYDLSPPRRRGLQTTTRPPQYGRCQRHLDGIYVDDVNTSRK